MQVLGGFFCDGKTPQWQSGRLGSAASGGSSDRSGSRLVCRLIELSRAPEVIIYLCMNEHITQNTACVHLLCILPENTSLTEGVDSYGGGATVHPGDPGLINTCSLWITQWGRTGSLHLCVYKPTTYRK